MRTANRALWPAPRHQARPQHMRRDSAFGFMAPYRESQREGTGGVRGTAVLQTVAT
jgi:hypothetical protein